jgi:hypothetical protein
MTLVLSLLCYLVAVATYRISQLQLFGKLKWSKRDDDFWGRDSGRRKYRRNRDTGTLTPAPNNWYYKIFNSLKYKEKFPLSGTLFVATVDGYHLMQFVSSKLFIAAIWLGGFSIVWALVYLAIWYAANFLVDKFLSR